MAYEGLTKGHDSCQIFWSKFHHHRISITVYDLCVMGVSVVHRVFCFYFLDGQIGLDRYSER